MQAVTITQITPPELETLIENSLKKIIASLNVPSALPEADELLTIQQAADLLKLSVPTLYSLVSRSALPVSKRGKRLYFSKLELTGWIKAGRKKTSAEIQAEAAQYLNQKKRGLK